MTDKEARQLYNSGEEPTIKKLIELDDENQSLKEKITCLESNSTNSSKPPSTDGPKEREERKKNKKKTKSGKKSGGQPGHEGKKRALKPKEEVDKIIECFASTCINCKRFKKCKKKSRIGEPERFQQTEIPPLKPTTTEYQLITLRGKCEETHKGNLPVDIEKSNFGPRLVGMMAYLTSVLHVARRKMQECLKIIFDVDISLGSCQNLLEETSSALKDTCDELEEALPESPVINADETGWYKRWLWIFVTAAFIYFYAAKSRGSIVLKEVLGNSYDGILGVDRWGAYSKYHKGRLQLCWEHLKRDFNKIYELGCKIDEHEAIIFAETMQKLRKKMMSIWYKFKEGEIDRETLIKKTSHIRYKIIAWLKIHLGSKVKKVKSISVKLYKNKKHLFTFIFYEGVEPTNNISERGIRPAVQWRKVCFGNKSDAGAILTSRLLTVTRTCWLKGFNALEFLVKAISVFRKGLKAPSLLYYQNS
jgi:transposase